MALSRETLARRIRDALNDSGVPHGDLAAAAGMDPTALSKALAGKRNFGSLEVALIAERLGLSTDTLLADEGAMARTMSLAGRMQSGVLPAVEQAVALGEQMSRLDQLLTDVGHGAEVLPALPAPPSGDPVTQGQALAESLRLQVGWGDGDLPQEPEDLAGWVEDKFGLDVCIAPLPSGVDGLALTAGGLRLALVSSGISATRQRFTLAHELCHLVAGDAHGVLIDEDVFGRRSTEEIRANAFAAVFLMPAEAIRSATAGRVIDEDVVGELLGRFRVSLDALAYRLHNLGIVNAAGRDRIRRMASVRIAMRPGRTNDLQARNDWRVPSRLLRRAFEAFSVGDLGIRPLAELVHADPGQLLDELSPSRFSTEAADDSQPAYAL